MPGNPNVAKIVELFKRCDINPALIEELNEFQRQWFWSEFSSMFGAENWEKLNDISQHVLAKNRENKVKGEIAKLLVRAKTKVKSSKPSRQSRVAMSADLDEFFRHFFDDDEEGPGPDDVSMPYH